jgi:hypothetical protein
MTEAEAARTVLYPIYFVPPGWDKERRQSAAEPHLRGGARRGGARRTDDLARGCAHVCERERGRPRQQASRPRGAPVALLAGGRLTVRLRQYKGSHTPKGMVRVFADPLLGYSALRCWATARSAAGLQRDPLLGYSARQAYVEDHLRHWRDLTRLRQRAGEGDLGFVGARRDAFLASSEDEARVRCCAQ